MRLLEFANKRNTNPYKRIVMLVEVSDKVYRQQFPNSPHPYISEQFIVQVKRKVDRVVRLMVKSEKVSMGLVAGIKNEVLLSPFSSPFGGFHFRHDNIFTREIDQFIIQLIDYASSQNIQKISLILPPDVYHHSFNTKMSNALLRNGFLTDLPEITNWIDLSQFKGEFSCRNARQNYNKSLQYKLSFQIVHDINEKEIAYQIVRENREKLGRPIYMTFNDLLNVNELWPVDFSLVKNIHGEAVAAAIFYRGHEKIVQGIFWGDNELGRYCRAMDFLCHKLWNHYKELDYSIIDLGTSSCGGLPNEGLIRFKEDHGCTSALRLGFKWNYSRDDTKQPK